MWHPITRYKQLLRIEAAAKVVVRAYGDSRVSALNALPTLRDALQPPRPTPQKQRKKGEHVD